MSNLDYDRLAEIDPSAFQRRSPYPWLNEAGLLRDRAFEELHADLPPAERFTAIFGKQRKYGQASHDRLALEYRPDLELASRWREFIAELEGPRYRAWLERMLGARDFDLRYHWHYTPRGCSVSPHCDVEYKLASHIFYFNTDSDWREEWGGQTLVLDDGGRFDRCSNPDFDDFDRVVAAKALGNRSFFFCRSGNSWHGVRTLTCPEGVYRKVFIVMMIHR